VTATDQLRATGERLLRLAGALGRLPWAPGGPEPFASLFQDPAAMLSDLLEGVLTPETSVPALDGPADGAWTAGPGTVAPPSVARPMTASLGLDPLTPTAPTAPPARRPARSGGAAAGGPRPAPLPPPAPADLPTRSTSPSDLRVPAVARQERGTALGGMPHTLPPVAAAPLPSDWARLPRPTVLPTGPMPVRPGRPAAAGSEVDGVPTRFGYYVSATPVVRAGAGALHAVPTAPRDGVPAPLGPAGSEPPVGSRLAQGAAEMAAALRTNLTRPSPTPAGRPGPGYAAEQTAPAPPSSAAPASPVPDPTTSDTAAGVETVHAPPFPTPGGGAATAPDIDELMERLTVALADEFLRVYGTSGR
jgi:hypothetical protein